MGQKPIQAFRGAEPDYSHGERTYTDLARRVAPEIETPDGDWFHLHLVSFKGSLVWVVRIGKNHLCGTPRCRRVHIMTIAEWNKLRVSHGYPAVEE